MKLNGILYIKASVLKFVSYCCFNMNPGGDIPMLVYVTKSKKVLDIGTACLDSGSFSGFQAFR